MSTGVSAGAIIAALGVFADWAVLGVAGFEPSISRELTVVDAGLGGMIGDTLSSAVFIVLGLALAVETLDHLRLSPIVSTMIVAIGAGLVAGSDQEAIVPGLTLVAGLSASAAIVGCIAAAASWRRGSPRS